MAQTFYINKSSVLPVLRMELVDTGRYDFKKNHIINNSLQNAEVTFSMKEMETGNLVVSKAKAEIMLSEDNECGEKAIIQYKWKERDTRHPGSFIGSFEIKFDSDLTEDGYNYPDGKLIVPIYDELIINIK